MLKQMVGRLRPNFSLRKLLRPSLLLWISLWVQFAHCPNAQAAGRLSLAQSPTQQQNAGAQNTQEVTTLESGKPVERGLAGGQIHGYKITLAEGQYVSVIVEQRGIDVVVRLFSPDGKLITEYDSRGIGSRGQETPKLVTEAVGVYKFEVAAKVKDAPAGRYEIRITELRAATETDRLLQQARIAHMEAGKFLGREQNDLALPHAQHALELYEKALGQKNARTAAVLQVIGAIYARKGEYAKAEPFFERSLEIREEVLPPNHLSLASSINELGLNNLRRGNYEKAERLFQRALLMFDNAPDDPQYPHIGFTLNCLAGLYQERGEYAKVEAIYQRVLTIWEKAYGPESSLVAGALGNLADLYRVKGDYVQAESLLLRAVAVAEKAAGEDQPDATEVLVGSVQVLTDLYIDKGDYEKAETLLERARAILEKLGPDHPYLPDFFDTLVTVSQIKGDFEKAERLSLRAIALREKLNGPEHFAVSTSLFTLATLYYHLGDYAKAEPLLQRALTISQKALGTENPTAASILDLLANIRRAKGEYTKADSLYHEALTMREKLFGLNHPNVAQTLDNLATLSAAKGDFAQALTYQNRANEIGEHNISLNLATGSERQKLTYLLTLSDKLYKTISLQARFAPDDPRARAQAAVLVLQRKGRVLDAMTDTLAGLRRSLSAEDLGLLDRLNHTTAQLARLVLEGSQQTTLAEQQNRIKVLEEQKEKLEAEISHRSADFYRQSQPVTLAAIQAAIPNDAALIELAVYRAFDPKADDAKAYGEPRYVAYVLRRQGEVQWKELGAAKAIDSAIDTWRQALRNPLRRDVQQLARAVDEKVMQPVRALTGDAAQLLVSPDGALNLIPFAALVDEQGRYLIQRYSFAYLTSGRDLLRMQMARASKSKPTVIANPSFGEPATEQIASAAARPAAPKSRRRSVTNARDLSEVYFAPLGGTAQEARTIQTLFPEASLLTGAQATESALKQVAAPRILHIATHGFFLQDTGNPAAANVQVATRSINANTKIENPLLRSGLALTGANLRNSGGDDGILAALEASGLNLWGTKLVVLSACDTGLGEVRNGEGVYGLRRAFVLAGAESLVMSLWPVSDYVTRKLMTSYYRNLKQGLGRGAALREVQLDMLKRNRQLHPFYWANFIQSGEWANLDGKRQ